VEHIRRARRDTIGDAFRRSARRNPAKIALRYGERDWSYADLDSAVDGVARYLSKLGLKSGDRVAAYGRNSDAYFLTWLGCARAGLIHVPVNYALTPDELAYIVGQSQARAIVCDAALEKNLEGIRRSGRVEFFARFTGTDGHDILAAATAHPTEAFECEFAADDVVQILYTSGTTAAPKGAMMTHAALLSEYQSCIVDLEYRPEDRVLAALPLYHTAQTHAFAMPQLLAGASIRLIEAPVAEQCLSLIEAERINSFFAPPTVWISLLRHPDFGRRDLSSLRKLYYGASIMPLPVLQEIGERLPHAGLYNCYGQSEIGPVATVLLPKEHETRPSSAGRPILNVETRVVDENMLDAPAGVDGEIVHRSPQLLTGYWDKPKETEEAFAGGWFHSGDLGHFDADGYLYIVDRIKDVINTGGVLVASREVEEALLRFPAVSEVAVVALPDPKWIEAVVAFVILRKSANATAEQLMRHARELLAPHKVPKRVIFVDDLPRNTAGKILKRELRLTYGGTAVPFDSRVS
jgi:fatty-acyl-CoA synthase